MHAVHKMHNSGGEQIAASVYPDTLCDEPAEEADFCKAVCIAKEPHAAMAGSGEAWP
jgi:hypothetical protein